MDGAVRRAKEFHTLAGQLDEQRRAFRRRAQEGQVDNRASDLLNRTMIRLSRVLVPVASTFVGPYGQDRYGHAWQTQMIPSLVPYPNLAAYARDSDAYQVWWVEMTRARNRVADALADASDAVRAALSALGSDA